MIIVRLTSEEMCTGLHLGSPILSDTPPANTATLPEHVPHPGVVVVVLEVSPVGNGTFVPFPGGKPLLPEWIYSDLNQKF